MRRLKVILAAGTRPNFMKIAPLLAAMKSDPECFDPLFVHTGQHYDDDMYRVFLEDLELGEPDIALNEGSGSHAEQTGGVLSAFESVLMEKKPDRVVVVGDVNSTLACGLAAVKLQIPVAHVESGLRSRDRTMPEEINRVLTDHLSDLLFTTCADADANLKQEGIPDERVHRVGNIMIESLIRVLPRLEQSRIHKDMRIRPGGYGLVTLHRPATVDRADTLKPVMRALQALAEQLPLVFPVHPRTRERAAEFGFRDFPSLHGNLRMIPPVGYIDFLALQKHARLVLTDSGGIQEETTFFQVPCLTLRPNTERPVTITEGTNRLTGTDPDVILRESMNILNGDPVRGRIPDLWDDGVSGRIVKVLKARSSSFD